MAPCPLETTLRPHIWCYGMSRAQPAFSFLASPGPGCGNRADRKRSISRGVGRAVGVCRFQGWGFAWPFPAAERSRPPPSGYGFLAPKVVGSWVQFYGSKSPGMGRAHRVWGRWGTRWGCRWGTGPPLPLPGYRFRSQVCPARGRAHRVWGFWGGKGKSAHFLKDKSGLQLPGVLEARRFSVLDDGAGGRFCQPGAGQAGISGLDFCCLIKNPDQIRWPPASPCGIGPPSLAGRFRRTRAP